MSASNRTVANRMIADKGQTVTLTREVSGTYDPTTGTSAITTSTQTGKGVILPFSAGLRKLAGTNIAIGDKQCLLSALKTDGSALTAPVVGDTLTDSNSVVYEIVEVNPLEPAGLRIFYDLTLRAAA